MRIFKLKTIIIVLLSILLGVIFFSCRPKDKYMVVPFETEGGWGYRIAKEGKSYIYQPFIPGIEGNHAFKTKEEAMRTGNLVLKKLKAKKIPSVQKQDLDSLQITYPKIKQ